MLNRQKYFLQMFITLHVKKELSMHFPVSTGKLIPGALTTALYAAIPFSSRMQSLPAVAGGQVFTKQYARVVCAMKMIPHMACAEPKCFAAVAILISVIFLMMGRHLPTSVSA